MCVTEIEQMEKTKQTASCDCDTHGAHKEGSEFWQIWLHFIALMEVKREMKMCSRNCNTFI